MRKNWEKSAGESKACARRKKIHAGGCAGWHQRYSTTAIRDCQSGPSLVFVEIRRASLASVTKTWQSRW